MAHCPYKCIACTTTQRDPQGAEKYSTLHLPSFLHSGMNVPTQALHREHHPRFVSPFRCCTVIIISRIAVTAFSLMRLIYYLLLCSLHQRWSKSFVSSVPVMSKWKERLSLSVICWLVFIRPACKTSRRGPIVLRNEGG